MAIVVIVFIALRCYRTRKEIKDLETGILDKRSHVKDKEEILDDWIEALYTEKDDPENSGRVIHTRRPFADFARIAFDEHKWDRAKTLKHPVVKKLWNDDKEHTEKDVEFYARDKGRRIPDNQLYEMKVS